MDVIILLNYSYLSRYVDYCRCRYKYLFYQTKYELLIAVFPMDYMKAD